MKQLERLKDIIEKDKETYTMKEIVEAFSSSVLGMEEMSDNFKSVKNKITQGEWNGMQNGLLMTFVMTLHARKLTTLEELRELFDTDGLKCVGIMAED